MATFASPPNLNGSTPSGSWGDPRDSRPLSTGGPGGSRVYAHIEDIISDARPQYAVDTPAYSLLDEAERSCASSRGSLDFGRPDTAYKEYLLAYGIAIDSIRRHKDFGFLEFNHPTFANRYKALTKKLSGLESKMTITQQTIKDNNAAHGTRPRSSSRTSVSDSVSGSAPVNGVSSGPPQSPNASGLPAALRPEAPRPATKPESLQGRPLSNGSIDLNERFARLRAGAPSEPPLVMPSAGDFQKDAGGRQSFFGNNQALQNRPSGPRSMPNGTSLPQIPPKVPLATNFLLPKAPSPTYSPINVTTPGGSRPHEGRPPKEKRQQYYNHPQHGPTASLPFNRSREEILLPYRPTTPNGINNAIIPKSSSSDIPHDHAIFPETLHQYMSKYNILLVDVRERLHYDEGHIMASSIICIEPISLREGSSAEELEDGLVVAPDTEQMQFSRRNQFDVVVYYDQRTSDISFLKGPPTMTRTPALRAFHDTLYEFNDTKPLKDGRPPALLRGGLDAWVDYMGSQSLATSNTAAMLGSTRQRLTPGRPLARQRVVSSNSRLEVRNRRLRAHSFLDEKEQQQWMQQANREQVPINEVPELGEGEYVTVEEEEAPPSPYVTNMETFLRRFPSVHNEQQSMTIAPRRPLAMPVPHRDVPPVPSIPSRPAPAVPRPSYSGQADIVQSQAPLARTTSSTRAPLYSSAGLARTRKLPRTGLTNFGVTCYMNATVQCLSATIPLSQFFTDRMYEQYVQSNWKGSSGIMPKLYANLVQAIWNDDSDGIKPTTFRRFCGRMNQEWIIDRQQDAKEFFDFLVDCLHEDLNVNWERTQLRALTEPEEAKRERMDIIEASPIEWKRFEHRDHSYISSLLAGQHASRLRCLTCKNTSTTYEAFYSISIEIPPSGQGNIYDCLRSYTKEERLQERWRCPHCKCEREATKQIILTRLPQFLVIHFKRFAASKMERAKKIHTPIEFPLHGLNMNDFVMARAKPLPGKDGKYDMATTPPFAYDAYGVLRHLGSTMDGGHYISMVKDPGRGTWRKFDDERHYDFDPSKLNPRDRLQNAEAYILFYQRAPLQS